MQDPLRKIFDGLYEPELTGHSMTKEESAVWEKAIQLLGDQAVDDMLFAQCRSLTDTNYDYFREGFRLGALLMLRLI